MCNILCGELKLYYLLSLWVGGYITSLIKCFDLWIDVFISSINIQSIISTFGFSFGFF